MSRIVLRAGVGPEADIAHLITHGLDIAVLIIPAVIEPVVIIPGASGAGSITVIVPGSEAV